MRLYIVGPAFGCPSIDPQCNAAVALLKHFVDSSGTEIDVINASRDFDDLPLLEFEGSSYYGYASISRFIAERSGSSVSGDQVYASLYRSCIAWLYLFS